MTNPILKTCRRPILKDFVLLNRLVVQQGNDRGLYVRVKKI